MQHDIFMRGKAGRAAKQARKVRRTEINRIRNPLDRKLLKQMRTNKANCFGDCVVFRCLTALRCGEQQTAQNAVDTLRAIHFAHAGAAQTGNNLRHFLLDMSARRRIEGLPAAAESDNLVEKCSGIGAVKMNPHGFSGAGGEKTVRLVTVDQCDLTAFCSKNLRCLEIHGARTDISQIKVFMAFLVCYIAAVQKIVFLIIIVVSDASDIEKQPACRGRGRGEKALGTRQHACLIENLHTAHILFYMIAQNMNKMQYFVIASL